MSPTASNSSFEPSSRPSMFRGCRSKGEPIWCCDGRKVSGNAQRRGRRALLHHGTLLYDFDPGLAARYLKEPIRRPAYRSGRCHADFIGNLPLSAEDDPGAARGRLEGLRPSKTRVSATVRRQEHKDSRQTASRGTVALDEPSTRRSSLHLPARPTVVSRAGRTGSAASHVRRRRSGRAGCRASWRRDKTYA